MTETQLNFAPLTLQSIAEVEGPTYIRHGPPQDIRFMPITSWFDPKAYEKLSPIPLGEEDTGFADAWDNPRPSATDDAGWCAFWYACALMNMERLLIDNLQIHNRSMRMWINKFTEEQSRRLRAQGESA